MDNTWQNYDRNSVVDCFGPPCSYFSQSLTSLVHRPVTTEEFNNNDSTGELEFLYELQILQSDNAATQSTGPTYIGHFRQHKAQHGTGFHWAIHEDRYKIDEQCDWSVRGAASWHSDQTSWDTLTQRGSRMHTGPAHRQTTHTHTVTHISSKYYYTFKCYFKTDLIPRWQSYCLCLRYCLQWDNVSINHQCSHAWQNERPCRLDNQLSASVE